jgi:predicted ATPase/class 3 adenylate cyclase
MENPSSYIPIDRRVALASRRQIPSSSEGAVLFADISGFTPLSKVLSEIFGARRGVDELTRRLNTVYGQLIAQVHRFGGSVIGFSGDAIMCWFSAVEEAPKIPSVSPVHRAIASGLRMQQVMANFGALAITENVTISLAIKTVVAAGKVRRMLVGDPAIQVIDVLAGAPLDRVSMGEQLAQKGELLVDAELLPQLGADVAVTGRRTVTDAGVEFASVSSLGIPVQEGGYWPASVELDDAAIHPWLLPVIRERLGQGYGQFLAELRPAVALFLRFAGLDYENDDHVDEKLDAYVRWVQAVLARYEGTLIQLTTGDKGSYLYAVFGAPLAHSDDPDRAVAAALDLRSAPQHLPFISQAQIGISQGRMRVGAYGSDTRRTYGVLGDATNLAARLMAQAEPGQILISQEVADVVDELYRLEPLGQVALKGLPAPTSIHAVVDRRQMVADQYAAQFTSPLVGREEEQACLLDVARQVLDGTGRIARIEGEAGVGKSRLTGEFIQTAANLGFQVAIATCQSTTQGMAYFAGRQIARSLLGLDEISGQASPEAQIAQIEAILRTMNPNWLVRLPLLGDLLGFPIPDNATTAAFEPRLRQEALATLAVEIAQARARQRPLLLVLEDIQWLDEASRKLLQAVARSIADAPLLLLLVHRPFPQESDSFFQEIAGFPHQVHLNLEELAPDSVAALVAHRLGGPVSALALSLIQALTQGNAFFTEELVDALRESGRLHRNEQGVWVLSAAVVEALSQADCLEKAGDEWVLVPDAPLTSVNLGVPDSIHGIVLSRLDRLPSETQLTLKVASVIGRVFEVDLLAHVHPMQPEDSRLQEHLRVLNSRDFARVEASGSRLAYTFKHNITQEVIYKTLLEHQRHELHLAVARSLEKLQPDEVERLAFHFRHGDLSRRSVRTKTLQYLWAAAQRAQREYANETALNYVDRALSLEVRWEWLKARVQILHILGEREEELKTLQTLSALEDAPADEVAYLWGEYFEAISDYSAAYEHMERALAVCRRSNDLEGEARCLARLGLISWRLGDYEGARHAYDQALTLLGGEPRYRDEEAEIRYGIGIVYRQQGQYEEASQQLTRALALYRALENRKDEARTLTALGGIAYLQRHYAETMRYYQQALQIQRSIGDRAGEGASLASLAQVVIRGTGDYSRAEQLLRETLSIQQAINNRWWEGIIWNELGVLYLMVGDLAAARSSLQWALLLSQELEDQAGEAYTLCNLGQVMREQGALDDAEQLLRQGLNLAQAQGDRHLEALYHSELAILYQRAGHPHQAIEQASMSLEILREMDLRISTTADLGTLALAYLAIGDREQALDCATQALAILDECDGEGPDFPHRDYFICAQVLSACGRAQEAQRAMDRAYHLLMQQANKISDQGMRRSFLENVSFNRAILQAVKGT